MDKTLVEAALRAADSLLGVAIHSGAHLHTDDAKEVRKLVQDAIASMREDHAQTQ